MNFDRELQLRGAATLSKVLCDLTKRTYTAVHDRRVRQHRIIRAGTVRRQAFFSIPHRREAAEAYVRALSLANNWRTFKAPAEVRAWASAKVPSAIIGRIQTLSLALAAFRATATDLLGGEVGDGVTEVATQVLSEVAGVKADLAGWERFRAIATAPLPATVCEDVVGWTLAEFRQVVAPLWPSARRVRLACELGALLKDSVRRVPNRHFESKKASMAEKRCEYLLDRADALLYAARQWGGHYCRMTATVAKEELGLLRDSRFVAPALASLNIEVKVRAISAIAFLWDHGYHASLHDLALNDSEHGVRRLSLWASGFSGGPEAVELLRRAASGPSSQATEFAHRALAEVASGGEGWWRL
jgi:hypothetical protein